MLAKPCAKLLNYHVAFVAMFFFATVAIAFASYQRLFCSFAMYDDEGYVMLSLQQFIAGGALYDDIYSQYGPCYYWLASIVHWMTDWPVSHDVTRIKTLVVWMSVSMMAAAWLYRVTRSGIIAIIGLLLVSFHLERLAMEPGHPQELCLLAVAGCMVLASFIRSDANNARVIAMMGVATAVCLLTKINVGVFLFLSISAAILFATRPSRLQNLALASVAAAMVVLPVVVGRHELFTSEGYRLPVLLALGVGVSAWVCSRAAMKPVLELRHSFTYWGVSLLVSSLIVVATVAAGTSWAGVADGILLQHFSFVDIHYHAPPIYALAPLAALLAVFIARSALSGSKALRVIQLVAIVLVVGAVLRHLVETFQPLHHGSQDRGQAGLLVSYFAAYAWIILLPLRSMKTDFVGDAYFARLSLCLIAVLQPLIAHPVPGTQMAIGSLALVMALLVAVHDAILAFREEDESAAFASRALPIGIVGLLVVTVVCRGVYLASERSKMPQLDLTGAKHLHLPEEFVTGEQWTVQNLRERADTFVCWPSGHNSLYLWSGIDPPTGFNATVWQDLLTDDHQHKIIAALESSERVCIVVDHSEPKSLRTDGPLLNYIRNKFEAVATQGTREIWERRTTLSPTTSVSIDASCPDSDRM